MNPEAQVARASACHMTRTYKLIVKYHCYSVIRSLISIACHCLDTATHGQHIDPTQPSDEADWSPIIGLSPLTQTSQPSDEEAPSRKKEASPLTQAERDDSPLMYHIPEVRYICYTLLNTLLNQHFTQVELSSH